MIRSDLASLLNKPVSILMLSLMLGLTSCGGGGDSAPVPAPTTPPPVEPVEIQNITGGGVKGPLANAVVTVYAFDASQAGFKGAAVGTGTTDASAAVTGLGLPFPLSPPYIMEFTSAPGTTDITTAMFPVITTMRTVITQASLDAGEQIYATPLTTMAVDIAVANAGTGATSAQFETALSAAAAQVVSTLGFGMDSSVNIFDTPPLINSTTVGVDEQASVALYRTAVEAVTAIAYQISEQSAGATTDTVLSDLAATLADNGIIDESAGATLDSNTLQILEQDPATLIIPNTAKTVGEVQAIIAAETATTGSTTTTTDLTDGTITTDPAPAETDPDIDNDGVLNVDDAFPENAAESVDTDGDGIGDVADPDDNNNGILDEDEGSTPVVTVTDTDGDGFDDGVDNCPTNYNPAQTNTDTIADGGDACDTDDDEDGVLDTADAFPLDSTESVDTDGDGLGNDIADSDDDNDGVADGTDTGVSPLDGSTACAVLIDCDGDGVLDAADFNPIDAAITFNFAPVTNDDAVAVDEDAALFAIDVTANDSDDDGNPSDSVTLSAVGSNDTALGAVAINGNSIDYTPVADASGVDTFSYTVTDGTVSSQGSVTVTITAVNDDPVITQTGPLVVVMDEDSVPTAFDAPAIDAADIESDTLTWTLSSAATSGTATVSGTGSSPAVTYVPNANANGSDSFDVSVSDGNGGSDVITIDVTVDAQNDLPDILQTGPLSVVMDEDSSPVAFVAPLISALDVETMSIDLVWSGTTASNGTASVGGTGVNPTITYVPNADFNGIDTFDVIVSDGLATSSITVDVTVNPQNDVPVLGAAGPFSIAEDVVNTTLVGTVTATDVDGSVNGYNITGGNTDGAFAIDSSGQLTVADTTVINFESGITSYNLLIRASDGTASSDVVVVVVDITDVNDSAPVVGVAGPFSIAENVADAAVVGTVTATDADGIGAVTGYSIVNGNTGTAFAISAGGQITVANTAAIDYEDFTSFDLTITATDGINDSAGEVVTVNITDANDTAPVIAASQTFNVLATAGNGTPVGTVSASDADGVGSITGFTVTPSTVFAIDNSGQITVAAALAAGTTYTLSVEATDGLNTSAAVNVDVTAVTNAPPVIAQTGPLLVTMDEDESPQAFVAPTISATDAEGDSLSWSTAGSANGLAEVFGTDVNAPTLISYTPDPDFSGEDSFIVNVFDGTSTDSITITVTVTPVNDAPVAFGDSATTLEDILVTTVNVLTNDTDEESDTLSISAADISSFEGGVVTNNGNGTFDYAPPANFNGEDSFNYTVFDGTDTAGGTVTITVDAVNDAPVATNDSETATIDVVLITGDVLANDSDVENNTLTITASDTASANGGTVADNGNNTFTYTPAAAYIGPDSFTYTVSDGEFTDEGTVNITVIPAGTPIAMTELMGPANAGIAGLDNDGPNEYGYWTDTFDAGVFSGKDYKFNHTTGAFEESNGNEKELILNGSSWAELDNIAAVDDGSGGLTLSLRDSSNTVLSTLKLTATYVDIGNDPIASHLDSVWLDAMFDANATFNTGAKLVTEYFQSLSVSYEIYTDTWCQDDGTDRYTVLNGDCNAIDATATSTGYAEILSDATVASAWVDLDDYSTPPSAVHLAWQGSKTLMVQLVSDGSANYYVADWNSADGASRVADAVAGTNWVQNADSGVEMIHFQVPESFVAQFPGDLEEGLNYFVTEQNGFVRRGQKYEAGNTGYDEGAFNGFALNDILTNFSGDNYTTTNLAGRTIYEVYQDTGIDQYLIDVLTFDADGTFITYDYQTGLASQETGTWDVNTSGKLHLTMTSGVDTGMQLWAKAKSINPDNGSQRVCYADNAAGPFKCRFLDVALGITGRQFSDEATAVSKMNDRNSPDPQISQARTPNLKFIDGSRQVINGHWIGSFDAISLTDNTHTLALEAGEDPVTLTFNLDGSGTIKFPPSVDNGFSDTDINNITWTIDFNGVLRFTETDGFGDQWFWTIGYFDTTVAGNVLVQITTPSGQIDSIDIFVMAGFDQVLNQAPTVANGFTADWIEGRTLYTVILDTEDDDNDGSTTDWLLVAAKYEAGIRSLDFSADGTFEVTTGITFSIVNGELVIIDGTDTEIETVIAVDDTKVTVNLQVSWGDPDASVFEFFTKADAEAYLLTLP